MTAPAVTLPGLCTLCAAIAAAGCAPPLMKIPTGAGIPAPFADGALAEATAACRSVSTYTAEIHVTGSVGPSRIRGRLLAGLATPASARLEAVAPFGPPLFIFVARDDDATLLLPRDERVLEHGRPSAVLEAVAGVPIAPEELRLALIGCATHPDSDGARALSDTWLRIPDHDGAMYLRRSSSSASWRVAAAVHEPGRPGEWRAEYGAADNGLPQSVRLAGTGTKAFDLRLELSQTTVNDTLGPDVFRVQVPRAAQAITIDELRAAGPLAARSGK
jgi:hypothetical protein